MCMLMYTLMYMTKTGAITVFPLCSNDGVIEVELKTHTDPFQSGKKSHLSDVYLNIKLNNLIINNKQILYYYHIS